MANRRKGNRIPFPTILAIVVLGITLLSLIVYGFARITNKEDKVEVEDQEEIEDDKPEKLHDNSDPNNILVLVNKDESLPEDYRPEDLVIPNVNFSFEEDVDKRYLREPAAKALEAMFQAAKDDGLELFAVSGFRSYERQKEIYDHKVETEGEEIANKLVALPGHSEHQTGLTMDVSSQSADFDLQESFEDTEEGKWVKENAHKYGYIIRYEKGKEDITGYAYEPWHLRFVGEDAAKAIYEGGLTLEEYLGYYDPSKPSVEMKDSNEDDKPTKPVDEPLEFETSDDPVEEDEDEVDDIDVKEEDSESEDSGDGE